MKILSIVIVHYHLIERQSKVMHGGLEICHSLKSWLHIIQS